MVIQDVMKMVHIHYKSHLTKSRKQTAYCNVSTRRGEVRMRLCPALCVRALAILALYMWICWKQSDPVITSQTSTLALTAELQKSCIG